MASRRSIQALGASRGDDNPFMPHVMERSYAAPDALGDQPTMDYFNPRWAQWFDAIKQNTGQNPTFANRGGMRTLPNSPGQPESPEKQQRRAQLDMMDMITRSLGSQGK